MIISSKTQILHKYFRQLCALVLLAITCSQAANIPDDEFYNAIRRDLAFQGVDDTMSKCVVDDLRKNGAAYAIHGNESREQVKLILEPYMNRASLICVRTAISYHVSTQRIINFSLYAVCFVLAIFGFVMRIKRIKALRAARNRLADDEPLLR